MDSVTVPLIYQDQKSISVLWCLLSVLFLTLPSYVALAGLDSTENRLVLDSPRSTCLCPSGAGVKGVCLHLQFPSQVFVGGEKNKSQKGGGLEILLSAKCLFSMQIRLWVLQEKGREREGRETGPETHGNSLSSLAGRSSTLVHTQANTHASLKNEVQISQSSVSLSTRGEYQSVCSLFCIVTHSSACAKPLVTHLVLRISPNIITSLIMSLWNGQEPNLTSTFPIKESG